MTITLPQDVKFILNTLQNAGYEAYAVGGCVRDSILGRIPDDWDITTSAKPLEVKELFPKSFDTGIQHGTITVLINHVGYEVTTYRIDGEYEDGRHPKQVQFTPNLIEDLKRRDFTINAMAYNDEEGLVDCFEGLKDIENKVIRCVGDPYERFNEDALRIMRAVRFAAQLGYDIDVTTKQAVRDLAPNLSKISVERINVELTKLLVSKHPEMMRDLYEVGITAIVLPEFDLTMKTEQNNPHHCYNVGEHTIHALMNVREDKVLRLAALLHDFGKPQCKTTGESGRDHFYGHPAVSEELAKAILRRLRYDNDTIAKVSRLVLYHDYRMGDGRKGTRKAMSKVGEDLFDMLLELQHADILAQSDYGREEKLENLSRVRKDVEAIRAQSECVSLKTLAVTGNDLIHAGMKPGKEIGETLTRLLEVVLENPERNTKEELLELVKKQNI